MPSPADDESADEEDEAAAPSGDEASEEGGVSDGGADDAGDREPSPADENGQSDDDGSSAGEGDERADEPDGESDDTGESVDDDERRDERGDAGERSADAEDVGADAGGSGRSESEGDADGERDDGDDEGKQVTGTAAVFGTPEEVGYETPSRNPESDDTDEESDGEAGGEQSGTDEEQSEAGGEQSGTDGEQSEADTDGEQRSDASTGEETGRPAGVGYAPDDEEQPLEEHITEMIHRFLAVAVSMGGVAAIVLLWSDDLINFLWYSFLGPGQPLCPGQECPQVFKPHIYHPLSLVLARLKVAVLVGFIVGLPVAVYQTYLFMRPGLYPGERRYYLAAVPTSLVLAAVGVAFAYALVLPALFSYFVGYTTRAAEPALGLAETFNIMVIMLGFFALVFQIPLLVMLGIMMGVTTRQWLEKRRLYFWMGFGGVAFIFSPDPTGMAPLLVALTMIGLFEGTLALLRWTGKDSPILAPEPLRARRPYAWLVAALAGYAVSGAPLPTSYYEYLPTEVTQILADLGWTAATPLVVALAIVVTFEVVAHVLKRLGAGLRVRLWIYRVRWFVWLGAAVIGYFASPDPGLLAAAQATALDAYIVVAVVLGIVVAYEVVVQLVVWRRGE